MYSVNECGSSRKELKSIEYEHITDPKRDFPFTMQYGISIFLHKAGSQTTNSMGSTSWAITTSWALFYKENAIQKDDIQERRIKAYREKERLKGIKHITET